MKKIIHRLHLYIKEKQKERQAIKSILRLPELGITFVKDTSITLGCMSSDFNNKKNPALFWKKVEIFTKQKDGDLRTFMRNAYKTSNKRKIPPSQYFDELVEATQKSKLRKEAFSDFVRVVSRRNLDYLIEHIFEGHLATTLIRRGPQSGSRVPAAKGIHSEFLLDGIDKKVVQGSRRPPNPLDDEIYEAQVQINGIDKVTPSGNIGKSTFFPRNWSKERILEEIAFAFKNKIQNSNSNLSSFFNGRMTNGVEIEFIIVNNEIKTVYPILN